ncbi:MAG: hypothetical protein ACD_30C00092G0039 [uncultured bacterium]|uniref:Uncharacterized protein n=2 Tax=Candidatus Daviesiibacteriota TaxID=1752718 RepID=A0A0G0I1R5_9BACT|nr:MAG: hypothetical protein ACD_30C00092G0039 [uncultured bacterium]KKQ10056.1 MAG: hypothetical protein US19_C0009G0058 [Candidatus Daviesbacteria bacterium GW2011_GWB1_36_5]KKQ15942.1 MAG: hypothetical protein US28_C0007G0033 [Candidatus Daviesbacteria bacterium GW2011_GWA1_36_8]
MTKKTVQSDYFDDCYLCKVMEKAQKEGKVLTVSEMKEAFKKANEHNPFPAEEED